MVKYDITVRIKLGLSGGDPETVFGKGTAELMQGVEATGSLNQAARAMGMAYSKAWTGIKRTEENLGFALLERRGQRGSVLTESGRRMLEAYRQAEKAAAKAAGAVLEDFQP